MKRILLLAVAISLFGYLAAQNNTWDVYLQGQAVKSIAFENKNVWAATDNFLVRLNKLDKSTSYYHYPDIIKNMQAFLKIDTNGVLWIARSEKLGANSENSIYSFDGDQWDKIEFAGTGPINSLAVDKNNNKWIATLGNDGLYVIEQDSSVQYTPDNSGLVYNYVAQVASDKDGNIWVANYDNVGDRNFFSADIALMKYDGDNWISYFSGDGSYLMNMSIDSRGTPWVEQFFTIQKLDTVNKSWTEYFTINLGYILKAIEGESKFWFTKTNSGIAFYDGSDLTYYTTSNSELPSNTVNQIAIDSDGTKWIATDKGLAKLGDLTTGVSVAKKVMPVKFRPTSHGLEISNTEQPAMLSLYDIQGRAIYESTLTPYEIIITPDLITGVYLVKVSTREGAFSEKVVVQ